MYLYELNAQVNRIFPETPIEIAKNLQELHELNFAQMRKSYPKETFESKILDFNMVAQGKNFTVVHIVGLLDFILLQMFTEQHEFLEKLRNFRNAVAVEYIRLLPDYHIGG
jgi:hypothetical protein